MAWSWSHTNEAYADARENLFRLDRETLIVIYAEWRAAQGKHGRIDPVCSHFSERRYNRALEFAKTLPDNTIAESIWEKAEEFSTCTNGGWKAWLCPFGCAVHMVPFDCDVPGDERISCC